MFPSPTAEPTAAAIAPMRVANPARLAIIDYSLIFFTKVEQTIETIKQ